MSLLVGVVLGAMSLIGYGLSDYFGALSSRKVGSFQSTAVSRAIALIAIAPLLFIFKIPALTLQEILFLVASGVLSNLGIILFYKALKVGNVSIATSISGAYPAVTILLLLAFFSTQLTYPQSAAIMLIILGTILVSFKYKDLRRLKFTKLVKGSEYAVFSLFAFGLSIFLEVVLVKDLGWFIPAFFIYFVMLVYNLAHSLVFRVKFTKVITAIPSTALAGITAVLGFIAFNYGVVLNYAVIVTPLSGASTMLTVLLALALLKERLEPNQKIGIALILFSAIVLSLV